ncbi:hypothetical protein Bca4012_037552 [Brassica carinata]
MGHDHSPSRLEQLPEEIKTEIIARAAKASRATIRTVMSNIPGLTKAAINDHVYKNMELSVLTEHPLASLEIYKDLMAKCLEAGNPEAHYVKGVQEYFHHNNTVVGLHHLHLATKGSFQNAFYLYGIVMLCREEMEVGQEMFDKLAWRQCKATTDKCWQDIKRTFHGIRVERLPCYIETLKSVKATIRCHPEAKMNRCDSCFLYKQMRKFVLFN